MIVERDVKINRILTIYSKLMNGEIINKKEMSRICNVSEKTIQRDLEDIRAYFYDRRETHMDKDIIYSRDKKGYSINNVNDILTKKDVLAIIKILLESRAFCQDELKRLTDSILIQVDDEQRKHIKDIIGNELMNYVPLKHGELLLSKIWDLTELIKNRELTQITYIKADNSEVQRLIRPVAIIFSEYYFYLIAYFNDFDSPTVFRVDRIKEYEKRGEKFYSPYSERFEDGEFRKRIQFMYPGKLINIRFEFSKGTLEAVIDKLPTAKVIKQEGDKFIIEAEVYGKGIIMWLLSQGSKIKVLSPDSFVKQMREEVNKLHQIYK